MTGRLLGQYEVGRLLGSGGMGAVYAARDVELDRVVALKFVTGDSPEADAGLRREARRASQLNHPNVCTIHQVGAAAGTTFFVMEYVAGQTLGAAIGPGGLPLDALVNYASQIAAAVGHAHDRGLLHRDLKSANVMLTPEGRIKVLDFGLAVPIGRRASELSQSHTSLAADEPVAGTLPYMAPELLLAKPPGPRSDIWAFGVLLYEMAVGRRPFGGTTGFELCAAILSREPAPLPDRVPERASSADRPHAAQEPGRALRERRGSGRGARWPAGPHGRCLPPSSPELASWPHDCRDRFPRAGPASWAASRSCCGSSTSSRRPAW